MYPNNSRKAPDIRLVLAYLVLGLLLVLLGTTVAVTVLRAIGTGSKVAADAFFLVVGGLFVYTGVRIVVRSFRLIRRT